MKVFKLFFLSLVFQGSNIWAQTSNTQALTSLPQIIPAQNSSDLQLTSRVNHQIMTKLPNFMSENFNIYSQNGQVIIQGRVKSQSEADDVLTAARTTAGVGMVVNGIIVNSQ